MLALHRAKDIIGWMSDAELLFLAHQASRSDVIYEIGSYQGRSTRVLGDNAKGIVFAVDPWASFNRDGSGKSIAFEVDAITFNIFYCNLYDLIRRGIVVPCISTWEDFIPATLADFIFIDGDHRYEAVKHDVLKAVSFIRQGGIIAGHDYMNTDFEVKKAVDEIFGKVNLVDTIWFVEL